uniref:Uncharacterized protein n=1 Tax=Cannabis sativa TaxID=3483 RepID=A0A803QBR9_CANSA
MYYLKSVWDIHLRPEQVLCDATNYLHQYSGCNQKTIISPQVHEDQPLPTACRTAAPTFNFRLYVDAAQDLELLKMGPYEGGDDRDPNQYNGQEKTLTLGSYGRHFPSLSGEDEAGISVSSFGDWDYISFCDYWGDHGNVSKLVHH